MIDFPWLFLNYGVGFSNFDRWIIVSDGLIEAGGGIGRKWHLTFWLNCVSYTKSMICLLRSGSKIGEPSGGSKIRPRRVRVDRLTMLSPRAAQGCHCRPRSSDRERVRDWNEGWWDNWRSKRPKWHPGASTLTWQHWGRASLTARRRRKAHHSPLKACWTINQNIYSIINYNVCMCTRLLYIYITRLHFASNTNVSRSWTRWRHKMM